MPRQEVFETHQRRNSLSWLEPIQTQGFAIIPGILEPKEIDALLDVFSHVDLPRSRAGVRHAMRLPAVTAVAQDARLMEIVRGDSWRRSISVPRDALRQIIDGKLAGGVAPRHSFAVAGAARGTGLGTLVCERWCHLRPRSRECAKSGPGSAIAPGRFDSREWPPARLAQNAHAGSVDRRSPS